LNSRNAPWYVPVIIDILSYQNCDIIEILTAPCPLGQEAGPDRHIGKNDPAPFDKMVLSEGK